MYYLTYSKKHFPKTIWGVGENNEESMNDAIRNLRFFLSNELNSCLNKNKILTPLISENIIHKAYSELIDIYNMKTIKCSKKLYKYVLTNGAEDFDDWKIIKGIGKLCKRT